MDVATVLTLVQTVIQLLDSPTSMETGSWWGYKSQLKKLRNTMSTIQAVLERQHNPTNIPLVTLERLQEAVYEADDLFDEVATVAQLKELMPGGSGSSNKLGKEVRLFFSRFNQLHYAFTKSREIRKLREILDDIANDHRDFGGLIQPLNVEVGNVNSSRETHSFLCEEDVIIGRDEEKQTVIDMLLGNSLEENVSVISIVGMGGLGKTALAKLVYNDHSSCTQFSPKMWVCVSDDFDVKSLLGKILAAATNNTNNSGLSKDLLQTKLRQEIDRNKYLLVLDDVWNEDFTKWVDLRNILIQGGRGSRIIVTTRSKRVANLVGSHLTHELKGLSDDNSWKLFQKVTLMKESHHSVEIGKEIVRKCFNVPLAIKFVGSFLQDKSERIWQRLSNTDLADIEDGNDDGIISVLKISYNHLPPRLKCCFTYCAAFPKDYKFVKEDLIYQWMAQGFIKPLNGSSLEDLGEEYFMKLLQGCFFQDVEQESRSGIIWACKMHDLVHDLAKGVAGTGINGISTLHDDKTRHIFIDDSLVGTENVVCYLTKLKVLRTCIVRQPKLTSVYAQFAVKMRNLRVLDLSQSFAGPGKGKRDMKTLPGMIGELLHLRYLDLSGNAGLLALPDSITKLYNLQTLKLVECEQLKELPSDLRKLVNLRHLDIKWCRSLQHMPTGMDSMTSLHKLPMFKLSGVKNNVGKLEDLRYLNNLTGNIEIEMSHGWTYDGEEKKGGYLIHKPFLNEIQICWNYEPFDVEALLQGLQPHPNTKKLILYNYPGAGFPRWGQSTMNLNMKTCLPNLVHLYIHRCRMLESLPLLSQLCHLKFLQLKDLWNLEFVENRNFRSRDGLVFFPSLEELMLRNMRELKGLLIVPEEDSSSSMAKGKESKEEENDAWRCLAPTLRQLRLDQLPKMVRLPKGIQHLTCLQSLLLVQCDNLEEIPPWIGRLSSLQTLAIDYCKTVKSLPDEMRNLTCLTQLSLCGCSSGLKERCKNPTGYDWPQIKHIPSIIIYY